MNKRLVLAILLPLLALAVQWVLWPLISPFVWFLFYPTVFFSARLGGFWGGLVSTVLSASIVWFFFIPPQLSWAIQNPNVIYSVCIFVAMGYLFSDSQERLRRALCQTEASLSEARAAEEKITRLYEKTLELDELKSQFFANVSHELRTPLTLIMSPLARRLASAGPAEASRREDEMMLRNARLLYRHVSDLLDAAKLEAGQMTVSYARINVGGLVWAMVSQFDSLARGKGIELSIEAPAELRMEADGEKLQRILLNLLSNAFKFTPEGGRVEVCLREEAGQAVITVSDNGPGVSAEFREVVFERFRQVDGGAERRFGGTGLGLAIVKEFAQLHGGSADVTETPGGEATFVARLPLLAPVDAVIQPSSSSLDPVIEYQAMDAPSPPRQDVDSAAGGDVPLVLVVEDNADMNAFIAETLRPDYRVACAFDGQEGLERAIALQPDLILSDLMMPRLSGDQMALELRRQPGLEDLPIVMLTAKADDALRVDMLKKGISDYINKPFQTDELLARIKNLLTARKLKLADKRSYEERLRHLAALVESSNDAIIGKTLEGIVTSWNLGAEKIFGYSADEIIGQSVCVLVPPELYDEEMRVIDNARGGKPLEQYETERLRKDGKKINVALTVSPIWDSEGRVIGASKIARDITERRAMEQLVREHAQRQRFALETLGVGEWELNLATQTAVRSLLHDRIFGYDRLLPDWTYERFLEHVLPEDRQRVDGLFRLAVEGNQVWDFECRIRRIDGLVRWIHARGQPRSNEAGASLLIGIVMDITERKQAEEEIRQLNADLELRVAERTAELTAANQELDAFAYAVSHDLRAPLRAMGGFSQALVEDYGEQLQGEAKVYLEQIGLASNKMGDLIDGLLTLSRSTRGELRHDAVDLSAISERLLAELAQGDPERRVGVDVQAGLEVRGDARMIEAVMRNLLGNAWKYSLPAVSPCIRLYAEERDGMRHYCVADNGAGFDMAHAGKLFQPFQRLHRQDEFPGIGIGLATVQRIIHRHGGTIEARGEPGKGAVFCFTLPSMPS